MNKRIINLLHVIKKEWKANGTLVVRHDQDTGWHTTNEEQIANILFQQGWDPELDLPERLVVLPRRGSIDSHNMAELVIHEWIHSRMGHWNVLVDETAAYIGAWLLCGAWTRPWNMRTLRQYWHSFKWSMTA